MQRLNLILGIVVLFLIAVFVFESVLLKALFFSYCLIVLLISGYLYKLTFTFGLFVFVAILTFGLMLFGIDAINISVIIFNFAVVTLASYYFRQSFRLHLKEFDENLKSLNAKFSKLKDEDLKTLQKNKKLEVKASEIEDLYEIAKEMSVSLEFEKIFVILQRVLKKRFSFKECTLIYVEKTEGGTSEIGKVLSIEGSQAKERKQPSDIDKTLFSYFLKESKPVTIREESEPALRERFNLSSEVETFIAVPLIVEKDLIGILGMEGLKGEDFDKFSIVAGQVALELKKAILYEQVEELALTDGLTKLFVRRHFLERLKEEIERSSRHKLPLALLMIDIDHFKKCNDTYGHLVGDVVLREVTQAIKANIREVDLAGRYGGEELCVALPETDTDGAAHVAERIRQAVEGKKVSAYDEIVHTTVSLGGALYPKDSKGLKKLIEAADKALYKAKNTGRNRVCVYEK